MGTSASSLGSKGTNPLIPPWADDQPGTPLPQPDPNRLRSFRTSFGKFVSDGNTSNLKSALGKFAAQASGGSDVGPRRLGAAIRAGGQLAEILRDAQQGTNKQGCDVGAFIGKPAANLAEAIAQAICGETPDKDWIRAAAQESVSAVFELDENFDPQKLTDDNVLTILVQFLSIAIWQHVLNEAGNAWLKAKDADTVLQREKDLLELTKVIIDQSLREKVSGKKLDLSSSQVETYFREAAKTVWVEWEHYND